MIRAHGEPLFFRSLRHRANLESPRGGWRSRR